MRSNFSRVAKIFFSPDTLVPFLVGSVFLAVLGNAVTQILFNLLGGPTTSVALKIATGALLIFGVSIVFLARRFEQLQLPTPHFKQQAPTKRRGLILLVSRDEPCRVAINYHLPELKCCWLICSAQSLELANSLRQEFPLKLQMPSPIVINDIHDPLEFFDRIHEIYAELPDGWQEDQVIADYTGMTAHGSVGMALACLSPERSLQYTPAELDEQLKPTGRCLNPIEIKLVRQPLGSGPIATGAIVPKPLLS